jgi:cell division protein DivIC
MWKTINICIFIIFQKEGLRPSFFLFSLQCMKKIPPFVKNKYFITTFSFLVYFLFLDDLDIITIANQKRKLSKLEEQRDILAEQLKETKNTLRKLKNLDYLESYARSEKFFKKDDEEIFVITFEEKKKK